MAGRLDLLGQSRRSGPPAAPSDRHPDDPAWRADALAGSRHSRLGDLPRPAESHDEERAALLCAQVCRALLRDFAPALLLLGAGERRRAQALGAYAFTLFDFARQRGVEGERLAAINRWQFTLEEALTGDPPGQPVFVRMAAEHRRRPWPEDALDALATAARSRASRSRTPDAATSARQRRELTAAAVAALTGRDAAPELADFGGALLRLSALQNLGEELRLNRWPEAAGGALRTGAGGGEIDPAALTAALRRECETLRPQLLGAGKALADLPGPYRRAAVFLLLAGLRLLTALETTEAEHLLRRPPRLGLLTRLRFLARARWRRPLGV